MTQNNIKTVSINLSEDAAIKALSQLSHLGFNPTPDLYSIWYSYYKGDDCDLKIKMDKILEEHSTDLRPFHFTTIINPLKKEKLALDDFCEDTAKIIDNTYNNVQAAHDNTRRLEQFIDNVSNDESEPKDKIIKNIQSETKRMMEENTRLHFIIQDERKKMEELQTNLQHIRNELITDSLTNIYNRRHFDECLTAAIKECNITNKPLSLFIFDIDHFKKFNDTHGHLVGDSVLKYIGQTIKQAIPEQAHHMFRYGGEEFVVIFEGIVKSHALKYAQIISNAISKREITKRTTNEKIGHITISGGIAEKNKRDTLETLIARADVALYSSKKKGRNQINIAA
jgi:diguanylate cyclase